VTNSPANNDYRKFVINVGNWSGYGDGGYGDRMSFGWRDAAYSNPHDYVAPDNSTMVLDGRNKRVGINNVASPAYNLDVRGNMRFYREDSNSTQLFMAAYGYYYPWNGYCYYTAYFSAGNNGGGGELIFRNGYGNNSQAYIYGNPIFLGGTQDTQVYIGGNQNGNILKLNDDLWFNDPQNGSIQLRNGAGDPWGTLAGYFTNYSKRDLKKDITLFDETKLESLYQDTKNTNIYSWRYKTEPDYYPLKYGPILDESPQYFAATVDESSILVNQYVAMLHGALKVAMQKIESLETRVSDLEKNPTQ